jgi:hypothetical protein
MKMLLFLREKYGQYRAKQAGFQANSAFFMLLCSIKINGEI